jgi:hypothetical protein
METRLRRPLPARDRAGTVWINDPITDYDAGPFGASSSRRRA